jgi:hypothetical protein
MRQHRWIERHQNRWAQWFFSIVLIGSLIWLATGIERTGSAYAQAGASQAHLQATTPTATPDPLTETLSPEVIREGKPTGILIGAIAILAIIVLSTARTLLKASRQPPDPLK